MKNLIDRLKARALRTGGGAADAISKLEKKAGMLLPTELTSLLKEIRNAVVFDSGAKFVPSNSTGRENAEGYLSVEVIYGGQSSSNGLDERNLVLKDKMPPGLIAIGEAPGGDQICLEKGSSKVFFWKHDVETGESVTEIASNMASFLNALEPDAGEDTTAQREVIEGESFLDF